MSNIALYKMIWDCENWLLIYQFFYWKFFRPVAIWENIRNSTHTRLYVNSIPGSPLSKCGSGIAGIISRVEI